MRAVLRKPLWRIAGIAGVIALPLWIWLVVLDNVYVGRSRVPLPETQQTVPYQTKGLTVYVTQQEAETAIWLTRIDFGLFGLIVLCLLIAGPYRKNSN